MSSDDDKSLGELIDEYRDEHKMYCLEGSTGVKKLEEFVQALDLNYSGRFSGSPILDFLEDNSGAIQAIIDWVSEHEIEEWRQNIISNLPEQEEDEDFDEEE